MTQLASLSLTGFLSLIAAVAPLSGQEPEGPLEGAFEDGFEDSSAYGPKTWRQSSQLPYEAVESLFGDARYVRSGESSVKLVNPEKREAFFHLSQDLALKPDTDYVMEFHAQGNASVLTAIFTYVDGSFDKTHYLKPLETSEREIYLSNEQPGEWVRCVFEIPGSHILEEGMTIRPAIIVKGTAYIDDFSIREKDAAPSESETTPAPQTSKQEVRPNLISVNPGGSVPDVDGSIAEGEYQVRVAGLMDLALKDLYAYPAEFMASADGERLYYALQITLPPDYTLQSPGKTRDEQALVSGTDLFYLMLRPDDEAEKHDYEGIYVAISKEGQIYDAWESIDWDKGKSDRDTSLNADWKIASDVVDGVWTMEVSVPWADLRLPPPTEERIHMLSFGVNLRDHRIGWQLHPVWFDHYQAFGQLRVAEDPLNLQVETVGQIVQGMLLPTFSLEAQGDGNGREIPYELLYLVSTPRMVAGAVGTHVFDQAVGAGQEEVLREESVYFWDASGSLTPGESKTESSSGELETPKYYVLEMEGKVNGKPVLYQKIPFNFSPPLTVSLSSIPGKEIIEAQVGFRGAREEDRGKLRIEFKDQEGNAVLTQEAEPAAEEILVSIPMGNLPPADYQVECQLLDRQDKLVFSKTVPFKKWAEPSWLKEPAGIEALSPDWVPAAWTPIEMEKPGQVSVWGRNHEIGEAGLVSSIGSQGTPILNAPVVVKYLVDGVERQFVFKAPTTRSQARGRVELDQQASSNDFDLSVKHLIEFDGMHLMTLDFTPKANIKVGKLWVEVPFEDPLFSVAVGTPWWQHGLALDEVFQTPRVYQSIWLGNDDVGCAFFTENYKGWIINSSKPRVTLETKGKVKTLHLLLVNEPSEIGSPLSVQFGLQATPMKPLAERLREVRAGNAIEPPPFNVLMSGAAYWNSSDSKPSPRTWQVLKDFVDLARSRNQQVNPYIAAFLLTPWEYINRKTPFTGPYGPAAMVKTKEEGTRMEEFFYFQRDWTVVPTRLWTLEPETRNGMFTTPSSSYTDFFVAGVQEILNHEPDFGGFFFDIAQPGINMDPDKGLAYTTKDGVQEGTFESLATRDFYKRLYWVFENRGGSDNKPWIVGHGFASYVPYAAFWDMTINGEEIKPAKKFGFSDAVLQKSMEGSPIAFPSKSENEKSYDAFGFRSVFGSQFGVANLLLPQYSYDPALKIPEHAREILSFVFLHNIRLRPAYIPESVVTDFWTEVEIPFGLADTEFYPYWSNGIRSEPESIKVSYYKTAEAEDYLVAVANWSGQEVQGSVQLPAQIHTLPSAHDMESGETITGSKNWTVKIPAHDLRVFRFTKETSSAVIPKNKTASQ